MFARARRSLFLNRLRAGRWDALSPCLIGGDPFVHTALFRAVDHALHVEGPRALPRLWPLARRARPQAARVWRALSLWSDHRDQAAEALARLAGDERLHGFDHMGARAWGRWFDLPRVGPASDAPPPAIFQFWDTPDPPGDVAREMAAWAAAPGYRLYDAAEAETYIRARFGAAEARLFAEAPHPAIQSDYFRLCRLAYEGGLYVDADARMRPGALDFAAGLGERTVLWLRTRAPAMSVANGFLAAPADAPVIVEALARASRAMAGAPAHVFDHAGPTVVTNAFLDLWDEGRAGALAVMSDAFVADNAMTQAPAAYKRTDRNWHRWQRAREAGS